MERIPAAACATIAGSVIESWTSKCEAVKYETREVRARIARARSLLFVFGRDRDHLPSPLSSLPSRPFWLEDSKKPGQVTAAFGVGPPRNRGSVGGRSFGDSRFHISNCHRTLVGIR